MRPFTKYTEQIEILKARGLIIENKELAIEILKRENYYSLINGYKSLFLIDNDGEKFENGVTIESIYKLFNFDKKLRHIVMYYILEMEHNLKSIIAHEFAKNHSEFGYLDYKEYRETDNKQYLEHNLKIVSNFHKTLSNGLKSNGSIYHYIVNHENVPIWVIINHITLGSLGNFFSIIKNETKINIAKNFNLNPAQLESFFNILTFFRNISAHDERLYNSSLRKFKIKKLDIHKSFKNDNIGRNDLFSLLIISKYLLNKSSFKNFSEEINNYITILDEFLNKTQKDKVLKDMGFIEEWFEIIRK